MNIKKIADSAAAHGRSELERVGYLDGWRGLAIVLVLQHHFFEADQIGNFGKLGVDIFFCLSGLLMSQILFIKRTPLNVFYKRRISRIFPSFLLYISVVYSFAYFQGNPLGWVDFSYMLFFIRNYYPAGPDLFNTGYPLAHIWSLSVEEHAYLLLSLLAALIFLKKRIVLALITIGCSSIVIHLAYGYLFTLDFLPKSGNWSKTEAELSFITLSAAYALLANRVAPYVKSWMPVLAFALSLLFHFHIKGFNWFWICEVILTPFLLAFAVNHLGQTPQFFRRFLSAAPLRLLGICSYSIYLWQQPFYQYIKSINAPINIAGLYCLIALIIGGLMFYLFENPCRSYLNKTWQGKRLQPAM